MNAQGNVYYGTTPTEAQLAQMLAAGANLRGAANRLAVSRSTLRTQLKSISAKTSTNRQTELIRLLLLAPARVALVRTVITEKRGQ
jgi:DNA-binding CsgD family transcriptional regulator